MAYFKVNPTGCNERYGTVQVRFDCHLEQTDPGYADHRVTVPVIPPGGYSGKVNDNGNPVDVADYNKWVASLPTETRDNPFCCHFRCFSPDVTDEEIVKAGEEILAMAQKNLKAGELWKNANPKVAFSTSLVKIQASLSRVDTIKQTNFTKVATGEAIK